MDQYYDKDKFTGGQPTPSRPPRKRPDNSGWYSWPVIIVLFAMGIWPVALLLLFVNIFGEEKRKNQPVSQRRPSAEERMEDVVERAMARATAKVDQRKSAVQESLDKARSAGAEGAGAPGGKTASVNGQVYAKAARKQAEKKEKKEKKEKGRLPGGLLRVLGICFLALAGILGLDFASQVFQGYYVDFEQFFASLGFLAGGGIMWGRGQYLARMTRRSQRYILAIGNVDAMPLEEIAKRVNRKPAQAAKELQKLIDKGYLGEDAYIDRERGYFLRFGATVTQAPEPEAAPAAPPKEAEEGYSGVLRNIRRANDRIADEELSRKIDRLEQISARIFKEVEEHPEKRERIRTFFDYYLPTTQKLLDTYAEFEATGVEGEHLREAKARIEQTMDAIVEGFEHQLDQLYSADAMDVVSDIKVMETMLYRDTATVAKDFGYPEPPRTRPKADGQAAGEQKAEDAPQQLEL